MKMFKVRIRGLTPLLQHRMPEETLMSLLLGTTAKKKTAIQKEITPREIAEKHLYQTEDGLFYFPSAYITGAFISVASDYKQKHSSRKSIKSIAGGVFRPSGEICLLIDSKSKPMKTWEVDIKKGTNHQAGAVAICRPRFDNWYSEFDVYVDDSIIEPEIAHQILEDAGRRAGIGSFRVNKGGYYGQFEIILWKDISKV